MSEMISFDVGDRRFNYRVGAILVEDGRVLFGRCDWEDFWYVPGGRVEAGETAVDSLRREIMEELRLEAEVGRLLWVIENFFDFDGKPFHELGLYFAVSAKGDLPDEFRSSEFSRKDAGGETLIFRWMDVEDVAQGHAHGRRIGPTCLGELLSDMSETVRHVVNIDSLPFERTTLD